MSPQTRMAGTVGGLMEALHGVAAAAIIAPVVRGRQVNHGQLAYKNVPEVWKEAVEWTIEGGEALTPANIRRNAERVMNAREAMIEDEVGISYDELGHPIKEFFAKKDIPLSSLNQERISIEQRRREADRQVVAAGFDPGDPDFPF